MQSIKKKYLIGGIILIAAMGFLLYSLLSDSLTYYYTPSELIQEGDSIYDKSIRVSGKVVGSSVRWDPTTSELWFAITDESANLPVVYKGDAPHNFEEDKDIVVEGEYTYDGIFRADDIMMKCASKYEAED
jgi:cytochrome c-type biogenesis protein CcmE